MNRSLELLDLRNAARILLAASVKSTFPDSLLAGGGSTPLGFYYDFIFPFEFQSSFLVLLEEGISRLIKEKKEFVIKEMVPFSAAEMLSFHKESFRAEDAAASSDGLLSVIQIGSYIDFLEGDLASSNTSCVGAVKLKTFEKIGKRQKKDVIRIWGAADFDKQSLKKFLKEEEGLVKRLHTSIGKELDLFSRINNEGSLWLWYPKGEGFLQALSLFLGESLEKEKFSFVKMPTIIETECVEDETNDSLFHDLLLQRASLLSNVSLNRVSEECVFLDKELTDFSCGLLKTVQSAVDLQYIFCAEKQLFEECISSLHFISKMLKILGFEYKVILSVRKVKPSALTDEEKMSADILKRALQQENIPSIEQLHSSFRGVKVEFRVTDALGRDWSTGFMQVSFLETNRNEAVIIRSTLGSKERVAALLLEQHEGVPFLLVEEQVRILALSKEMQECAEKLQKRIRSEGFRVTVEISESKQKRQLEKIPFLLILDKKEENSSTVRVRVLNQLKEETLTIEELILRLNRHKEPE